MIIINNINILRQTRLMKGLTVEDMSTKLNISNTTYCNYEANNRTIPADIAIKISKILELDIKDIFLPTRFTIREHISNA